MTEDKPQSLLRRLRWLLVFAGLFFGLWLLAIGGNSLARYMGWAVTAEPPERLSEQLRPFYRTWKPAGPGPFPTALFYSGCDGPSDAAERWAGMLVARGWAAIAVDSHGPRDFVDSDIWRLICAGQLLMGSERAGDVLVSIYDARRMPFVDPDRLALIGASHGGWAIMELLSFEKIWRLPYNLAALPEGAVEHPLQGVRGVILLYPYCGAANRSRRIGWRWPAPVLFLLAQNDSIAPPEDCLQVADLLAAQGVPVETAVFAGATHGFDQELRKPFSTLVFDPAVTREAMDLAGALLDQAATAPAAPPAR